jgi:hypothetical protein
MINNGLCYVHLPTEITFSVLDESATAKVNALHTILDLPPVVVAGPNPYFARILELGIAAPVDRNSPLTVIGPVDHPELIPLSMVDLIVAVGGDVEGLPVFFELSANPATIDCPFSTTTPKEKWSTWGTFGQSHIPTQIGNKWYRSSAVGESGTLMNASWWAALSRANVISLSTFQAIQSANQGPII